MKKITFILFSLVITNVRTRNEDLPPNIVIIVADDLGIGDLGCFGNDTINTPNIDRLSREGTRLTHHLAAASLCTPSRAALLTARYPARFGLVGEENTPPVIVHIASKVGIPLSETTFAHAFSAANYTTAAVGKWHLGSRCGIFGRNCRGPLDYGFSYSSSLPFTLVEELSGPHSFFIFSLDDGFFQGLFVSLLVSGVITIILLVKNHVQGAIISQTMAVCLLTSIWFTRTHYRFHTNGWWRVSDWMNQHMNGILMDGVTVVQQPLQFDGLSQHLVQHSIDFMEQNQEKTFLLYHSFGHVHTPMFSARHMKGVSKHGRYGDNVEEMDEGVGTLLKKIDELGLANTTIVYFVSDHGGHLEAIDEDGQRVGGYNGKFKGGKGMGAAEGGIRVPGIIRWPGKVLAGHEVSSPTSLMDIMPTLLHLANLPDLQQLVSHAKELDGVSFAESLQTLESKPRENVFIHHCRKDIHALRLVEEEHVYKMYLTKHRWRNGSTQCGWGINNLCGCYGDDVINMSMQPQVYDLSVDPYEDYPLNTSSSKYDDIITYLKNYLKVWKRDVIYPESQFRNFWDTILSLWYQPFKLT